VLLTVGEPIMVPRRLSDDELETRRQELESEVNRLMGMCEARLEVRGDTSSAETGRPEEGS
jgi:hypothetical protein